MTDLPRDLARPRRDWEDVRLLAGVYVGGALMLLTGTLLLVAILLR